MPQLPECNANQSGSSTKKGGWGSSRHGRLLLACSAAALLALSGCEQKSGQQQASQASDVKPEVSVVVLHPQSVAITAQVPGRTVASLVAEVRPQVGGIILKRLFKEGSEVKAGDVLYQIDPAAYKASYDSALAALEKAKAAVPSAQAKVDRYDSLTSKEAVSKQDYDDALSTLQQAKADVAAEQAAVDTAKINLDYTTIKAPISGRIDASSVTVGALVTAEQTTALATINQLDPINVDVTQSSTNLLKLRQAVDEGRIKTSGDNVQVELTLEDGSKYKQAGKFEFLEASVSQTVGTVTARAVFPNPERLLLPGMYVRATIAEGVAPNSYLVPQRAVSRNTKGEATAMFVDDKNTVHTRVINVERNVGNDWLVSQGIQDGEKVIVEGTQRVRDDQTVKATAVTIDEYSGELKTGGGDTSAKEPGTSTDTNAAK